MLVIFRGLPGTGKSFLVQKLVERRHGFLVLSRDALRASIIPRPRFDQREKGIIDDFIVEGARFLLERGLSVVIDGMALSSASRVGQFVRMAESTGAPWRIVECECAERTALARIAADAGAHPAGDRGSALFYAVKARFEPIDYPRLVVDGGGDAEENVCRIQEYLLRENDLPA